MASTPGKRRSDKKIEINQSPMKSKPWVLYDLIVRTDLVCFLVSVYLRLVFSMDMVILTLPWSEFGVEFPSITGSIKDYFHKR